MDERRTRVNLFNYEAKFVYNVAVQYLAEQGERFGDYPTSRDNGHESDGWRWLTYIACKREEDFMFGTMTVRYVPAPLNVKGFSYVYARYDIYLNGLDKVKTVRFYGEMENKNEILNNMKGIIREFFDLARAYRDEKMKKIGTNL